MISSLHCCKYLRHVYFLQCTTVYLYYVYAYFAHSVFMYVNNWVGSVYHILKF
jgi:hypothetical protein